MQTGHVISGVGHLGLIGWILFGGVFNTQPLPFEIQEVSVISGADFQAIMDARQAPEQVTEVAQPAAPEAVDLAPDVAASEDVQPDQPVPQVVEQPTVETPPLPDMPPPDPTVSQQAPLAPETPSDVTVLVPDLSAARPIPRPAERVAPEAVAQPDPETTPDDVEQAAVAPEEVGEVEADPQEATAPEEATTETVTEATEAPAASPTQSPRPPSRRPDAPRPQVAETQATPTGDTLSDTDDAVLAALQAAQSSTENTVPTGPPLSSGEKEALRVGVSTCWNVGSLSSEALATTVVVSVQMAQDGKPITGSISMTGQSGGSDAAAKQAFEAARRAIIRCGAKGFNLPAEKYSQWQTIEMTFDPTRMRIK